MTHNAADEESVEERQKQADLIELQLREDIRDVLALPQGVRLFRWFMKECHMFSSTFTGNSRGMFNEGERNIALKLIGKVEEADPLKLPDIMFDFTKLKEKNDGN